MARYRRYNGGKERNISRSQKWFLRHIINVTGRTFWELIRFARLKYKTNTMEELYYEEAEQLIEYCYNNIDYLVVHPDLVEKWEPAVKWAE
jgi:hypothetical protein